MNLLKLICVFFALLLTACAPSNVSQMNPENHTFEPNTEQNASHMKPKGSASSKTSWEISGAIAARNSKKGWSASLDWVQQGANQYQIRLLGPFGGGSVMIEKHGAMIHYLDGPKKIASNDADQLLQQQTGTRLPVKNLFYWVRGLPAPGPVQLTHRDSNGHLTELIQSGYKISYSNYTTVNQIDLPGKIQLQGHDVMIKLVIKRWR